MQVWTLCAVEYYYTRGAREFFGKQRQSTLSIALVPQSTEHNAEHRPGHTTPTQRRASPTVHLGLRLPSLPKQSKDSTFTIPTVPSHTGSTTLGIATVPHTPGGTTLGIATVPSQSTLWGPLLHREVPKRYTSRCTGL